MIRVLGGGQVIRWTGEGCVGRGTGEASGSQVAGGSRELGKFRVTTLLRVAGVIGRWTSLIESIMSPNRQCMLVYAYSETNSWLVGYAPKRDNGIERGLG